jgi:hypothetical protein
MGLFNDRHVFVYVPMYAGRQEARSESEYMKEQNKEHEQRTDIEQEQ